MLHFVVESKFRKKTPFLVLPVEVAGLGFACPGVLLRNQGPPGYIVPRQLRRGMIQTLRIKALAVSRIVLD